MLLSMNNKLKPSVKTMWVNALRSGEYKQGRGRLRTENNEFCCLGVLCNLHAQAHPKFARTQLKPSQYDRAEGLPTNTVLDWAGINNSSDWANKAVSINNEKLGLACHNDQGRTFEEIAKAIEEQL